MDSWPFIREDGGNLIINTGDDDSSSLEDSDEELITLPMDDVGDDSDFNYIACDFNSPCTT